MFQPPITSERVNSAHRGKKGHAIAQCGAPVPYDQSDDDHGSRRAHGVRGHGHGYDHHSRDHVLQVYDPPPWPYVWPCRCLLE